MRFRVLPPPDDAEVRRVVDRVARRVGRLLVGRGLGPDADATEADPLGAAQPLLAGFAAASVRGRTADGRTLARRGDRVDPEELSAAAAPRCAAAAGFTLHANVAVPARDRRRLERLCRYAARPPVATGRLECLADGRLLYRLRHRWRDGTTHVVFEPQELLQRLVPLIPAPGAHQVRYHGVLAPCAGAIGWSRGRSLQRRPHGTHDAVPLRTRRPARIKRQAPKGKLMPGRPRSRNREQRRDRQPPAGHPRGSRRRVATLGPICCAVSSP
jgi:hypothetical protein